MINTTPRRRQRDDRSSTAPRSRSTPDATRLHVPDPGRRGRPRRPARDPRRLPRLRRRVLRHRPGDLRRQRPVDRPGRDRHPDHERDDLLPQASARPRATACTRSTPPARSRCSASRAWPSPAPRRSCSTRPRRTSRTCRPAPTTSINIAANTFSLQLIGLELEVAGMLKIDGTAIVTRRPTGDLDFAIAGATIAITVGGTDAVHDPRQRDLHDQPDDRLQAADLPGHRLLGRRRRTATRRRRRRHAGRCRRPPTSCAPATSSRPRTFTGFIDVVFTDRSGTRPARRSRSSTPARSSSCWSTASRHRRDRQRHADRRSRASRTRTATRSPASLARRPRQRPLPARLVLRQLRHDARHERQPHRDRAVRARRSAGGLVGPIAELASPANGEQLTALDFNARRSIDITYRSLDGTPLDLASITRPGAVQAHRHRPRRRRARPGTGRPIIAG